MADSGMPEAPRPDEIARQKRDLDPRIGHEWEALKGLYEAELEALRQRGLRLARDGELAARTAETGPAKWPFLSLALLLLTLMAALAYLGWSLAQVTRRADDAERRATEVAEASAREAASRMALESVASSAFARSVEGQRMAHVLAAPDLVRTPLEGGERAPMARGLMLWSASSGAILTGLGVPRPSDGRHLIAWVVTTGNVYRLGSIKPESNGSLRAMFDPLPLAVRSTRAFAVTEEVEEEALRPGEAVVLTSR